MKTVAIYLDYENDSIEQEDVYKYLLELIEDESLDYAILE